MRTRQEVDDEIQKRYEYDKMLKELVYEMQIKGTPAPPRVLGFQGSGASVKAPYCEGATGE